MPLSLTQNEIREAISHCQEASISFIKSGRKAKRSQISKSLRDELSKEIGKKCPTCERIITIANPPSSKVYQPIESSFTIEHLFPLRIGGDNTHENLMIAMCSHCNSRRNSVMQHFLTPVFSNSTGEIPSNALEDVKRFLEWSISSVLLPNQKQDREIQELWENMKKSRSPSISSLMERISSLEDRIAELENSRWRRLTRFIDSLFRRKTETPKKILEHKQHNGTADLDFTPEEFSRGLLRHKSREGEMTFNFLYGQLIIKESKYNLKNHNIKPSSYLEENCSDLLGIEKRFHKNGKTFSYWITEKENLVEIKAPLESEKENLVEIKAPLKSEIKTIILQQVKEGANTSSKLGHAIIAYQDKNNWDESGKKAFNKKLGLPESNSYVQTIREFVSDSINIDGNPPMYTLSINEEIPIN